MKRLEYCILVEDGYFEHLLKQKFLNSSSSFFNGTFESP